MIEAFQSTFQGLNITSKVMNSQELDFPDAYFTHSITNFSIFNFQDALAGVREIHRTLKPSGQAVITTWERFGIGEVIHVSSVGSFSFSSAGEGLNSDHSSNGVFIILN